MSAHVLAPVHRSRRGASAVMTAAAVAVLLLVAVFVLPPRSPWAANLAQPASPTPTVTPLPVATAAPALPLPVGAHVASLTGDALQQVMAMGLTWFAFELPYSIDSDVSNLTLASLIIGAAHERGLRVMVTVTGTADDLVQQGAEYNTAYAGLVGALARLGPEAIQVWREPNIDRFWPSGEIDAAAYVALLAEAHAAIKAVDEAILVVSAAPTPTSAQTTFPDRIVNDDVYYAEMAAAGAAAYADCIGVHYVEGVVPPDATTGDPRDDYGTRYLRTMLARAAVPFAERGESVPLCVTALGYASLEGLGGVPPYMAWAAQTTLAMRADWLAEALTILSEAQSPEVALAILWNVSTVNSSGIERAYSLIEPDGRCAACDAIAGLRRAP